MWSRSDYDCCCFEHDIEHEKGSPCDREYVKELKKRLESGMQMTRLMRDRTGRLQALDLSVPPWQTGSSLRHHDILSASVSSFYQQAIEVAMRNNKSLMRLDMPATHHTHDRHWMAGVAGFSNFLGMPIDQFSALLASPDRPMQLQHFNTMICPFTPPGGQRPKLSQPLSLEDVFRAFPKLVKLGCWPILLGPWDSDLEYPHDPTMDIGPGQESDLKKLAQSACHDMHFHILGCDYLQDDSDAVMDIFSDWLQHDGKHDNRLRKLRLDFETPVKTRQPDVHLASLDELADNVRDAYIPIDLEDWELDPEPIIAEIQNWYHPALEELHITRIRDKGFHGYFIRWRSFRLPNLRKLTIKNDMFWSREHPYDYVQSVFRLLSQFPKLETAELLLNSIFRANMSGSEESEDEAEEEEHKNENKESPRNKELLHLALRMKIISTEEETKLLTQFMYFVKTDCPMIKTIKLYISRTGGEALASFSADRKTADNHEDRINSVHSYFAKQAETASRSLFVQNMFKECTTLQALHVQS